jgi:hypothetical protein
VRDKTPRGATILQKTYLMAANSHSAVKRWSQATSPCNTSSIIISRTASNQLFSGKQKHRMVRQRRYSRHKSNLRPEAYLYSASTLPAPHAWAVDHWSSQAALHTCLHHTGGNVSDHPLFLCVDSTPTHRAPLAHHLHAICFESSATKDGFESAELYSCRPLCRWRMIMMPSLVPPAGQVSKEGRLQEILDTGSAQTSMSYVPNVSTSIDELVKAASIHHSRQQQPLLPAARERRSPP